MSTLFAGVRSIHYASTLLLYGELVFLLAVAGRTAIGASTGNPFSRRFVRVACWSLVVSIVSGVAWFAVSAAVMSGSPLVDVLEGSTLTRVLRDTEFGRVWMLRFGVAVAFAVVLVAFARASRHSRQQILAFGLLALAAIYVAALAGAGHAAAAVEADGDFEILADVTHLFAAGAWLGALPGFVYLLRRAQAAEALPATRRFSRLGLICVVLLTASGVANAWFLVGDVPALIGTRYGRLLLIKLALFGIMLALAVANRWYCAIRLADGDARASRLIRRNATSEIVAGLVIVAIVGVLGVTPPAIHEPPVWPFVHTLSFERAARSQWLLVALVAGALTVFICVGVMVVAIKRQRVWQSLGGLAAIVVLAAILVPQLATPAYPTTYQRSPIPYTTDAIVAGEALYAANCLQCHGRYQLDRGHPTEKSQSAAADPNEHALGHKDGEHYWWIARGIPGTSMPGFGARLDEDDIWNLVEFLNAQVEAEEATAMADRIRPLRAIVAPDFTFESADRPQEALRQLRGKAAALLVLYTVPDSVHRLRELEAETRSYASAGARVIVAPFASPAGGGAGVPGDIDSALAHADPTVATAYAMFARQAAELAAAPTHVEFLIDRDGYLRVRWIGVGERGARRTAEVLDRLAILRRETPLEPAQWGHRHR